MVIQEKNERLTNFLTPALLIPIWYLLQVTVQIPIIFINLFTPIFPPDTVIANLTLLLLTDIIGTILTIVLLIPLFKVKTVEHQTLNLRGTLNSLLIFCFGWTIVYLMAWILWIFFTTLQMPIESSYEIITLTAEHMGNPLNIALALGAITLMAPVFEELLFRRIMIPLLENRGMTPLTAVLTSSIGFAFIHTPNDLLRGSLSYAITHWISVTVLGIMLGITYVLTRNILLPILLHGLNNLVSMGGSILIQLDNFGLLLAYGFVLLGMLFIGIGVGVYALWKWLSAKPADWVSILKEKSPIKVFPGVIGFLLVSLGLITFLILADLIFWQLIGGFIYFIMMSALYLGLFAVLLWLITRIEYVANSSI